MPDLEVNLPCDCGATVLARPADAGGALVCTCGRAINVPKLSNLRTRAGADAYVTNPVESIRKALATGKDPAGDKCIKCGSTTPVFYRCTAICERSHADKAAADPPGFVSWFLLPVVVNVLLWLRHKEAYADRQGYDVEISFNLPVCDLCSMTTGKVTRPAVARQLMLRVPLYRELLGYYPNLTLQIAQSDAPHYG